MVTVPFNLPGFVLTRVFEAENQMVVSAQAVEIQAACPACLRFSERVHSYYTRSPKDLPLTNKAVRLILTVRRFRCLNKHCPKQTFVERLPEIVAPYAQRTVRLNTTLKIFADNLSAKTGARLLKKLKMKVSPDSLLRLLKVGKVEMTQTPKAVGVDDFAFRRNQTYGTILINLDTHKPVDLLPDRTANTLIEWLKAHPGIEVISRDRSTEYTRAINEGAPQAIQVADRWHVIKNLREMLERLLNRLHPKLIARQKAAQAQIEPGQTGKAGKRVRAGQRELEAQLSRLKRHQRYQQVVELYQAGHKVLHISQELGLSRSTVYKFISAASFPERANVRPTKKMLDPYVAYLEKRWQEGCHNAKTLWQELVEQGYKGGYRTVRQWVAPRREKPGRLHSKREKNRLERQQAELTRLETELGAVKVNEATLSESEMAQTMEENVAVPAKPVPAARHLAWLLIHPSEKLKAPELEILNFIRQEGALELAYELSQRFLRMIKERADDELEWWLTECEASGVAELVNFGAGLGREVEAIRAAISLPYSNGPTEGQVNKLKMIKRTLYGRGSFEVLRRRVLLAA